jgi:vitamin B12/bleomycin/antimicrobial peptide transport system ATP-binding/permease protein
LSVRMQWAEGSYRAELNTLLHRSFHVAALRSERGQKSVNRRRYLDIDQTWASLNWINAGYVGFQLVYNFIGSRFVAYAPGLLPYVDNKINLQNYVTGAELANALINACSWFIHVMPDIATLRANARRITDLALAIEAVQQPQEFYAQTGPNEFRYAPQNPSIGLTVKQLELFHSNIDRPFLVAPKLNFRPGEWILVVGKSGSGKTSLFRALNGLWSHGRGTVLTPRNVRSLYATQDVRLPAVSLKDLICLPDQSDEHLNKNVATALRKAGLGDFSKDVSKTGRDGQTWDQLLSGGQKQKLVLAKILLLRPGLLFLDEATSALDIPAVHAYYHAIKDLCGEVTVIAVTHDISGIVSATGISFFDSVLTVDKGFAKKVAIKVWRNRAR